MKKKYLNIIVIIYIVLQSILGYFIQMVSDEKWIILSYTLVSLAFLFNLVFISKSKSFIYTFIALLFTLIADFFLVVLQEHYLYGVLAFLVVQTFYFLRILHEENNVKLKKLHLIIRIFSSFLGLIIPILILKDNLDLLSIASVICYINLLLNVIFSLINLKTDKLGILFSIGLILFSLCDLVVGIYNITDYI